MKKIMYLGLGGLMVVFAILFMISCSDESVNPENSEAPEASIQSEEVSSAESDDSTTSKSEDTSQLKAANIDCGAWNLQTPDCKQVSSCGVSNSYFYASGSEQVFNAPRSGCTTPNSNNTRSELRQKSSWSPNNGTHTLSARLKVVTALGSVCVGQIHLDKGSPSSTKPLCELFFYKDGSLHLQVEASPSGGQISGSPFNVGSVGLGNYFTYQLKLAGRKLTVIINGKSYSYTVNSAFTGYTQYFKAGCYNQSSGSGANKVQFSSITLN